MVVIAKTDLGVSELWDTDPVTTAELKKRGLHLGRDKKSVYVLKQDPESNIREIPTSVNAIPIVAISAHKEEDINDIFWGQTYTFSEVIIPDGITIIRDCAFRDCLYLTSVEIPNSIKSIGNRAFENCYSLTSVTIPNNVSNIGKKAFHNCTDLNSITISNSVTKIGDNAFEDCKSLTSVTIPNKVTDIVSATFYDCEGLKSVTISNNVTSIGHLALSGCRSLFSVVIPDTVEVVGRNAFENVPHIYYHGKATGAPWGAKEMN